jgi:hypothetical protein
MNEQAQKTTSYIIYLDNLHIKVGWGVVIVIVALCLTLKNISTSGGNRFEGNSRGHGNALKMKAKGMVQ